MYYLRLSLPVILVIFILGAKPRKAKGQDPDKVKTKTEKTHIAVIECDDGDIVKIDTIIISSADEDFDHAYIITSDNGKKERVRVKLLSSENDSWAIITEDDEDGDEVTTISIRKKDGKDGEKRYILKKKSKDKDKKGERK